MRSESVVNGWVTIGWRLAMNGGVPFPEHHL